jgi:hypothetical protein
MEKRVYEIRSGKTCHRTGTRIRTRNVVEAGGALAEQHIELSGPAEQEMEVVEHGDFIKGQYER